MESDGVFTRSPNFQTSFKETVNSLTVTIVKITAHTDVTEDGVEMKLQWLQITHQCQEWGDL